LTCRWVRRTVNPAPGAPVTSAHLVPALAKAGGAPVASLFAPVSTGACERAPDGELALNA